LRFFVGFFSVFFSFLRFLHYFREFEKSGDGGARLLRPGGHSAGGPSPFHCGFTEFFFSLSLSSSSSSSSSSSFDSVFYLFRSLAALLVCRPLHSLFLVCRLWRFIKNCGRLVDESKKKRK